MPDENSEKKKGDIVVPRDIELGKYEVPDFLKTWDSFDSCSSEYRSMMEDVGILCTFIAKQLNEGPEVKDSVTKRILALRAVIRTILGQVFTNNFNRIGVLDQIKFDIEYDQAMALALAAYQRQAMEENKRRENYAR